MLCHLSAAPVCLLFAICSFTVACSILNKPHSFETASTAIVNHSADFTERHNMNTNPKSLKTTDFLIRERCSVNFKLTEWVKVVVIHPARLEEVDVLSGNLTASFLYIKIPPLEHYKHKHAFYIYTQKKIE